MEFEDILAIICLVVIVVCSVLPIHLTARARRAQPLRHPMGWVSYTELLANGLSGQIEPLPRRPVYGPFSSEASNKALALLKRWLSPEQRRELEKRGSFDVVGCHTGRRYRIHPGKLNNVRILQDNVEVAELCFAPTDADFLPEADIMLAQKIALETNEKAALKVTHYSSPLSLLPSLVTLTLVSHGRFESTAAFATTPERDG